MVDFVESLREIKEDGVCLFVIFEAEAKVSYRCDELRFTASFLSEPMLEFIKGRVVFKVVHDAAVDYVF